MTPRSLFKVILPVIMLSLIAACGGSSDTTATSSKPSLGMATAEAVASPLTVTPATATLAPGATQSFTATATGSTSPIIWSVDGVVGGSASAGTITAGSVAGASLRQSYYTAASKTQTVAVKAGDLVVVGWSVGNSPATTTCADSAGNQYLPVGKPAYPTGCGASAYVFYGIAKSDNDSLKITVTSLNTNSLAMMVQVVQGVSGDPATVLDAYALKLDSAQATSHQTATIVTKNANDYLYSFWVQDAQSTSIAEAGTGFTILRKDSGANATASRAVAATGSYQESVSTGKSVVMSSVLAAFKAGAGTGSSTATYTAPAAVGAHTITATCGSYTYSCVISVQSGVAVPVTVTANPTTASTSVGGTVAITATVAGSSNTDVTWTVDGISNGTASVGTISGGGNSITYTAPGTTGTHTVTATSTASPTATASTTVSALAPVVSAPSPIVVVMNPAAATLAAGGTQALTATVTGATNTTVLWTVDGIGSGNATVGTISGTSNSVTYTAPAAGGVHTVVATSAASSTASAAATLTVQAPNVTVSLTPASSVTVSPSATQSFTAAVSGSSNTAVTWSVDGVAGGNATTGTISGSGATVTYTAPSAVGTHTVTATSTANQAMGASTLVTVKSSTSTSTGIALTPSLPTAIGSGGQLPFSAAISGSTTDSVTWSVDGIAGGNASVGNISAAGVYTCPPVTTKTIRRITATSVANPGLSASVRILTVASNTTVNAKTQFGATGNGSTDDTAAITKALAATGNGICYVPAGTYLINPTAYSGKFGLYLNAGNTLLLDPGAVLQCKTQSGYYGYSLVGMEENGIALVGGTLVGDRVPRNLGTFIDGSGTDFEAGDGVCIADGSGMILLGVTAKNNCCDGFYIYNSVTNVVLSDCVADNNRRQGASLVMCSGITLQYCTFSNTNGNDPACGLDFEPNSGSTVANVQVIGCTITGNVGGGIAGGGSVANGPTGNATAICHDCTITGCTITGNGGNNYQLGGIAWDESTNITYTNNIIKNNLGTGIWIGSYALNYTITGNTVTGNKGDGIYLSYCTGTVVSGNTATGNTGTQVNNADGTATVGSNTTK